MVDIEINAWSSLFLNLMTNLILFLYPEKCIKFNQTEKRIRSREIWNFACHLRFIYKNGRDYLILKTGFCFFCTLSKNNGLSKLNIRIKQSGFKFPALSNKIEKNLILPKKILRFSNLQYVLLGGDRKIKSTLSFYLSNLITGPPPPPHRKPPLKIINF